MFSDVLMYFYFIFIYILFIEFNTTSHEMPPQRFKKQYLCQCPEICGKQNLQPGSNFLGFFDWKSQARLDAHKAELEARREHHNPTRDVDPMIIDSNHSTDQGKKQK